MSTLKSEMLRPCVIGLLPRAFSAEEDELVGRLREHMAAIDSGEARPWPPSAAAYAAMVMEARQWNADVRAREQGTGNREQ